MSPKFYMQVAFTTMFTFAVIMVKKYTQNIVSNLQEDFFSG